MILIESYYLDFLLFKNHCTDVHHVVLKRQNTFVFGYCLVVPSRIALLLEIKHHRLIMAHGHQTLLPHNA